MPAHGVAALRLKPDLLIPDVDPSSQDTRPLDAKSALSDLPVSWMPSSAQQRDSQSSQAAQIFTQCGLWPVWLS